MNKLHSSISNIDRQISVTYLDHINVLCANSLQSGVLVDSDSDTHEICLIESVLHALNAADEVVVGAYESCSTYIEEIFDTIRGRLNDIKLTGSSNPEERSAHIDSVISKLSSKMDSYRAAGISGKLEVNEEGAVSNTFCSLLNALKTPKLSAQYINNAILSSLLHACCSADESSKASFKKRLLDVQLLWEASKENAMNDKKRAFLQNPSEYLSDLLKNNKNKEEAFNKMLFHLLSISEQQQIDDLMQQQNKHIAISDNIYNLGIKASNAYIETKSLETIRINDIKLFVQDIIASKEYFQQLDIMSSAEFIGLMLSVRSVVQNYRNKLKEEFCRHLMKMRYPVPDDTEANKRAEIIASMQGQDLGQIGYIDKSISVIENVIKEFNEFGGDVILSDCDEVELDPKNEQLRSLYIEEIEQMKNLFEQNQMTLISKSAAYIIAKNFDSHVSKNSNQAIDEACSIINNKYARQQIINKLSLINFMPLLTYNNNQDATHCKLTKEYVLSKVTGCASSIVANDHDAYVHAVLKGIPKSLNAQQIELLLNTFDSYYMEDIQEELYGYIKHDLKSRTTIMANIASIFNSQKRAEYNKCRAIYNALVNGTFYESQKNAKIAEDQRVKQEAALNPMADIPQDVLKETRALIEKLQQ